MAEEIVPVNHHETRYERDTRTGCITCHPHCKRAMYKKLKRMNSA